MNPLTNTKNQTKMNKRELELGMSGTVASWHYQFRNSAWVFIGGLNYDLTEGDILTVFSQYGEIVNLNLVRDKVTGKAKGFAFLCYENQQSTVLAVDNFNGVKLLGRTIRVDHVNDYKVPKDDDDEEDEVKKLVRKDGCGPEVRVEKLSKKLNKIKKSEDDMHKNDINKDWRINKEGGYDDNDNNKKEFTNFDKDQAESTNLRRQKKQYDDNDKSKGVQIKEEKDDGDYNISALVNSLQTKIKTEKEVVSSKSLKRCHAIDDGSDNEKSRKTHTEKSRNNHSEKSRNKHSEKSRNKHSEKSRNKHSEQSSDKHIDKPRDYYNDKPRDKYNKKSHDKHTDRLSDKYTDEASYKNNDSFCNKYSDKHSSKKIKEVSSDVKEKSKESKKYDHDKNLNSLKYNNNTNKKEDKYKKYKGNDYDDDKVSNKDYKDRGEGNKDKRLERKV